MLDADADAVLCEDDVLAAHALGRGFAHLGEGEVDLVEDPAAAADEGKGDNEGDDLARGRALFVSRLPRRRVFLGRGERGERTPELRS